MTATRSLTSSHPAKPVERKGRILVLESVDSDGSQAARALDGHGYDVLPCFNNEDALHRVHREKVDLVIADTTYAVADCYELTRELRRRLRPTMCLPILLVIEPEDVEAHERAVAAGADDVLAKPIEPIEIVNRVAKNIHAKRIHDRLAEALNDLGRERQLLIDQQNRLMPRVPWKSPGWQVEYRIRNGNRIGSDSCDLFQLADGRLVLALADARGCGHQALMSMAMAWSVVRTQMHEHGDPGRTFGALNREMISLFDSSDLMTFYVGVLDPATGQLTHCSAGHPNPILINADEDQILTFECGGGPPIGVECDGVYESTIAEVPPGDRLLLATNGMWDQRAQDGEVYGLERFLDMARVTAHLDLDESIDFLFDNLDSFVGERGLQDDAIVVMLARDY